MYSGDTLPDYARAHLAANEAGNAQARKARRRQWNKDDYLAASEAFVKTIEGDQNK